MKKTCIYVALILGGIVTGCQTKNSETTPVAVTASSDSTITIATIDTDSIFANYDMVADVMKELDGVDRKLSGDLEQRAKNFQTDYENYLKVGATMTLSEQKKKEEQLQQRQQELQQLEQRYTQQLMETRAQKNQDVQDKIFAFVEEYNKANGNFTIILSKARTSGVIYSLPSMDITEAVLEALNADYSKNRKK
ncbi:MAG: OmpH family outer membrane protein [Bacteroidales bacterium]|jgi:outer membrane protein|nr:OmpH family outer membrane protein [Bacteroidales bacterium]